MEDKREERTNTSAEVGLCATPNDQGLHAIHPCLTEQTDKKTPEKAPCADRIPVAVLKHLGNQNKLAMLVCSTISSTPPPYQMNVKKDTLSLFPNQEMSLHKGQSLPTMSKLIERMVREQYVLE